jgi:hypothetical protein
MSFPPKVREDALLASGRHCCLCHKFCGLKIELHHIVHSSEGGADTFDNCTPLCFECHADMRSYDHKHPKGTKYTPEELRRHRDAWYIKVSASPGASYTSTSKDQDVTSYHWLVALLPFDGVMSYVQSRDFGAPFQLSNLEPLDQFAEKAQDPSREFIDADLEGMRRELISAIAEFRYYMFTHTWPMRGSEYQAIPREWEDDQPDRFAKTIDKLNDLSRAVATAYTELVREARRRLGA